MGTCFVSCRRLDSPGSFAVRDRDVVPIASMYKVLVALEVADAFASGALLPSARVTVGAEQHSVGGLGMNEFAHPVEISLVDLLYLSLAWSDNTASDLLLSYVGLDALHARARALELETMQVVGGCRTLLRNAGEDFGYLTETAAAAADWDPPTDTADLKLNRTTRASMADLVQLGSLLASEQAAQPDACRVVSDLMTRQISKSRFAAAFPDDSWTRISKTGTLAPWRGEFGLLTRNDGAQLALAVVLRQHHAATPDAIVDQAIADVARSAVAVIVDND
nr:serine hydrolase [Phytoactinopolyspora mesophila]